MIGHSEAGRLAKSILRLRRKRGDHLPTSIFGEHAWTILLALFVADVDDRRCTVRALAKEHGIRCTTCERWLDVLKSHGLVTCRDGCEDDHKVCLTAKGRRAVEACMDDALTGIAEQVGSPLGR